MKSNSTGKVGWLTDRALMLAAVVAVSGSAACGSATSVAVPPGSTGGSGGGGSAAGGGRTAIRSVGNPHRGFVSTGHVLKSDHFQMISALGPPAVIAGSSSSAHARLRSGLTPNMSE